ncbi:proline-rich extensin-like protein EPR1 isoform X2 [Patiria miniata]|uniref:WAP domain-containing protein n=1 Tax=Patiria miniata TaxID=46514 RepID=A0A914BAG7_PATMI|nr:proline-rich extensin-like protein EPR1 isoform X2 [Patiria miniata]
MKQIWLVFSLSMAALLMVTSAQDANGTGTKPGTCPYPRFQWGETCPPSKPGWQRCTNDSQCPGDQKCCSYWRIMITDCYVCLPPEPVPAVTESSAMPPAKPKTPVHTPSVLPTNKPPVTHPVHKPNGTKPGTCPYPQFRWGETCPPEESPFQQLCKNDSQCPGDQKCCSYWQFMNCYVCLPPEPVPAVTESPAMPPAKPKTPVHTPSVLPTKKPLVTHPVHKPNGTKPGTCPYPQFRWGETCPPEESPFQQLCKNDSQCPGDQKCCSYWRILITDCYVCLPPIPPIPAVTESPAMLPAVPKTPVHTPSVLPTNKPPVTHPIHKPNGTKPGTCPYPQFQWGETCPPEDGPFQQLCKNDSQCPGDQKCCSYWRIMITDCYVCVPPVPSALAVTKPPATPTTKPKIPHEGVCPAVNKSEPVLCVDPPPCRTDQDCMSFEKCCFTGCSHMCVESTRTPPIPLSLIGDPVQPSGGCTYYDGQHYENGRVFRPYDDECTLCQCFNGEYNCYDTCSHDYDYSHVNAWVAAAIAAGGALLISLTFTMSVCCCLKCCCKDPPHQTIVMQQPPVMQYQQGSQPGNLYIGRPNEEKQPLTSMA